MTSDRVELKYIDASDLKKQQNNKASLVINTT